MVVRCGGFLKGEVRHYPILWDGLKCGVTRKSYQTNVTLDPRGGLGQPLSGLLA